MPVCCASVLPLAACYLLPAACRQSSFHFTVTQIFYKFFFLFNFSTTLGPWLLTVVFHSPACFSPSCFITKRASIVNIFPLFSISFHSFVTFPDCCVFVCCCCCCLVFGVWCWRGRYTGCSACCWGSCLWGSSLWHILVIIFEAHRLCCVHAQALLLLLPFSSSSLSPVRIWPVDWARE